jgi:hypothetical protein
MMIYKVSCFLVKQNNLNNWDCYSRNIGKFPYIGKYLGPLLTKWVKNTRNPLAIPIVFSLLRGELRRSEEAFKELENSIGESTLKEAINEIEQYNEKESYLISIKNASLWAELLVSNYLKTKYSLVRKINERGDWLCNDSIVYSVKTKLDLDLDYSQIENSLIGLSLVDENNVVRKYNTISIMRPTHVDYSFKNKIFPFFETCLVDIIYRADISLNKERYFLEEINNVLKVRITGGIFNGIRQIVIVIREERPNDEKKHSVEVYFKQSKDDLLDGYFLFQKVTDGWWGEPEIRDELLNQLVDNHKKDLDMGYKKLIDKSKEFIGWINISLHPKYQDYSTKNESEVRNSLYRLLKGTGYKTVVSFSRSRTFEIGEFQIFEIG